MLPDLVRRYPTVSFYFLAYVVPVVCYGAIVVPKLAAGQAMRNTDALIMFPIMELCVFGSALALTAMTEGRAAVRGLFAAMGRWRADIRWYALAVLTFPIGVLVVLTVLSTAVSPDYRPNVFPIGLAFGLLAGFFEETAWTGYVLPRMLLRRSALSSALWIGLLWVIWHLPVVDFLGAAGPHGSSWALFYLAFGVAMLAVRVLIVWVYCNTGSLGLCQLMHVMSTGSLVAFGAPKVTSAEEAAWYLAYGAALWIVAALAIVGCGPSLVRRRRSDAPPVTR